MNRLTFRIVALEQDARHLRRLRWDFLPAGKDLMSGRAEPCSVV